MIVSSARFKIVKTAMKGVEMAKILRQDAERLLSRVPEEFVFWCRDGRIMRDMKDLEAALSSMTDETFNYHSNDYKKDFGNWVRDVIGDEKLARDLDKAGSRIEAARVVARRITFLGTKLGKR